MANDLVRWGSLDNDGYRERHEPDTIDDNEQWDSPPDQPRPRADKNFSSQRRRRSGHAADNADRDAADARIRGDKDFAFTREGDAADLRQSPWDWGDFRTWAIIVGMCAAVFLFTAFVYFMPHGRHAQNDSAEPVPQIRVY